jgi:glycosyltransferase involved in cell wall biosynthesis
MRCAGPCRGIKLRIALTVDPEIPVPPIEYGGIERIVDMLAHELVARGHDVTLFAHRQSSAGSRLVPWPGQSSRSRIDSVRNAMTLARQTFTLKFDLIHSFSRVAYLAPLLPLSVPKLMTYQREITRRVVGTAHSLSRGSLWFTAISHGLMRPVADIGTWRVVFNGVRLDLYDFRSDPGPNAPLVFLGRVEEIKGPHLAIEVAGRAGRPLVIAGNVPPEHQRWFESEIAPHIDGSNVTYLGAVNDAQKNELLGRACALLMPVLWEEPFGIVMPEAMACGTPVIGSARGAIPEVVVNGLTGFVCNNVEDMVAAVARLPEIDRAECRSRTERLFGAPAIADAYEAIYREMLSAWGPSRGLAA